MALTLRSSRSSNLTATEVDNNFLELSGSIADIVDGTTPAASASYALTASYALNGGGGGGGLTIKNPTDGNATPSTTAFSGIESLNFMQPITLSYSDTTASISIPSIGSSVYENGAYVTFTNRLNFIGATITDGDSFTSIEIAGGGAGDLSAVASDIVPEFDGVYDLGASDKKWFDGYFTNQVNIGTGSISDYDGDLAIDSNLVVQGVVSAEIGDFGNILISGSTISANTFANPYAEISGSDVLTVDSGFEVVGDVVFSYASQSITNGTWAYGDSLNVERNFAAGCGTDFGAIVAGGAAPGVNNIVSTEIYNGVSWNSGGDLPAPRLFGAMIGNPDNAQCIGSNSGATTTLSYDGTEWSTDSYSALYGYDSMATAGAPKSGITAGGSYLGQPLDVVQVDNGSAWTNGPVLIQGTYGASAAGTSTATLLAGGIVGSNTISPNTYGFDGITWTSLATMWNGGFINAALVGTQNAAIVMGGSMTSGMGQVYTDKTQIYDGIAWSFGTPLLTIQTFNNGAGNASSALTFGGQAGSSGITTGITQIYNTPKIPIPTLTYSAENGFLVLSQVSQSLDFTDDSAAEAGGVPLGGLYHSSGAIKIRLA